MGWFGAKKESVSEPPAGVDTTTGIDFAKYELDELGSDIRSIVDLPGAIAQAAKYAFGIPIVVVIVVWIVFSSRMGSVGLFFFALVAFGLSFFGSVVIGGYAVARRRLDLVAAASNRVIDTIGVMHTDVVQVKDGHAGTSVQQVAVGLLENAIFPAVFGTIRASAETALGPFGRFTNRVTSAPMAMVQRTVISAVESLPDKEIGQIVDDAGARMPDATDRLAGLRTQYEAVRDRVDHLVAGVTRTALGSSLGFALVASVPLFAWLVVGWVLS